MAIMATKILSGWCWQSTIRHFLPPPRLFPVTSRHLAHPEFVLDKHQHRGFLNIWEAVRRRIQPFLFRPIVTFSWKSLNFSTQPNVKWASMEKQKNIESNIVFLQCPNISLCSCQDFPGECVECGGDPDPISSISPLTLLTYFTTIPTLHTKHVSSWLVKKSVVFISNQPVWPCPMTKVCYKPGRPDKTKGGSVAQLALLRYLPTHFPNSSDLQRPLLGSRQLGIG